MSAILIFLSSVLALVSFVVYIVAILQGRAKPHRTTRFVILVLITLTTASLFAQSSAVAIWLSGIFTLGSLIVFVLSIPYGMGGWEKSDIACLAFSFFGILLWKQTANPLYGLFAFIATDLIGQIPMLIKTYRFPQTEVWTFYFLDVIAAVCSLLALSKWTTQEVILPLYVVCIDGIIVCLILRKKFASA